MPSTADAQSVGALVLGFYEKGELQYAGRVGTGFTHKSRATCSGNSKRCRSDKSPFGAVPAEERGKNGALWVEPKFVAEVDFRGWTHGERVRQASFQGLREDKRAKDVVRERKMLAAAASKSRARKTLRRRQNPRQKPKAKQMRWPATSGSLTPTVSIGKTSASPSAIWRTTTRKSGNGCSRIWFSRVIAIVRCPEGAAGECFFQKHASAGVEADLLRLVREPDGDKAITVDDLDGLIALAQSGGLEIHVRGSSADDLENADRLVFDLDPGPGITWKDIVAAARDVRERARQHQA